MPEITIALDDSDEELAIFGTRDQHLRRIREAFHVRMSARRGELTIDGEIEQAESAAHVIEAMRRLYRRQRAISAADVTDLLGASARPGGLAIDVAGGELEIRHGQRAVRPRSPGQAHYLELMRDRELVFAIGPAGTGKTYLAVAVAVSLLRAARIKKIVLVRPAVEAGERLGFLPGDLEAKINPYLRPLFDALHDLMEYGQLRRYIDHDLIELAPLAYMRGRTLNDAFIILDEAQNATVPQMKMFLTRMGQNARIVVTGDPTQVDLPGGTTSGLADAVERLRRVAGIGVVTLGKADIVRHPLVQSIVDAYETGDSEAAAAAHEQAPAPMANADNSARPNGPPGTSDQR
jgi:phosphate starvation-inducible PhoH-like protein